MVEQIITVMVLITAIFIISVVTRKRMNPCVRYALWLIVAIKLLVPLPDFESSINVMNAVKHLEESKIQRFYTENITMNTPDNLVIKENAAPQVKAGDKTLSTPEKPAVTPSDIVMGIWICGAVLCGIVFLCGNIRFRIHLKKNRTFAGKYKNKLDIYEVSGTCSPCLFGFIKPAVYLNQDDLLSDQQTEYVLQHEYTHYRHGDHIWSLVRCACVILYWYHPLVWLAAYQSINDGECACDAGTLKRIGEENNIQYGRTLIAVADRAAQRNRGLHVLGCSTSAASGKREMKKRIKMIVNRPRRMMVTTIITMFFCCAVVGCTFGNAAQNEVIAPINESAVSEQITAAADNIKVEFEYKIREPYEYGIVTASNQDGVVWTYKTGEYLVPQVNDVQLLQTTADKVLLLEGGKIVALNLSNGKALWENTEFEGAGAVSLMDDEGRIYLSGYFGPDLQIIDANGVTVKKIERFDEDYAWPFRLSKKGNTVRVSMEAGPNGTGEFIFNVNLKDYSYYLEKEESGELPEALFSAEHMPVDGYYYNSTDGARPHTCEIKIRKVSENAFKFSIWETFDKNGEFSDKQVFEEHLAVFESKDATEAVYRGENYTLSFDCSEEGYLKLSGFDEAVQLGNVFENIAVTRTGNKFPIKR